ncbi:MAG: hypothetical protein AAFN78_10655 [Pseudomonadota bacterium]
MNHATRRLAGIAGNLLLALCLALPSLAQAGRGELINLEEAAEVSDLSLSILSNNTATVYARICDQCELLSLQVSERTEIRRGAQRMTLQEAAGIIKAGATVLFDPKTLEVTRILYWQ